MSHEIIIITCKHDAIYKLDKEKLKRLLRQEFLEIIRIERAKWT